MFSNGELGSEMKMYMQLLYIKVGIKARSDLPTFVFLISRWHNLYRLYRTPLVAQMVKRLPTMWERPGFDSWVWFLGQEDPLEKEMAHRSSTLAWKIPWTEEHDRVQSKGSQRVGHDWATSLHFTLSAPGCTSCNRGISVTPRIPSFTFCH